jgi:hypothetical protein
MTVNDWHLDFDLPMATEKVKRLLTVNDWRLVTYLSYMTSLLKAILRRTDLYLKILKPTMITMAMYWPTGLYLLTGSQSQYQALL